MKISKFISVDSENDLSRKSGLQNWLCQPLVYTVTSVAPEPRLGSESSVFGSSFWSKSSARLGSLSFSKSLFCKILKKRAISKFYQNSMEKNEIYWFLYLK